MKSEDLLYSLDHVGEDLLSAADQTILVRKHQAWGRIAVAAVLVTALGLGSFHLLADKMSSTTPSAGVNPREGALTSSSTATESAPVTEPSQLLGVSLSESSSSGRFTYRLPCINADTPGATAINEAISQHFSGLIQEQKELDDPFWQKVDFYGKVYDDILSVVVHAGGRDEESDYQLYCYEISTGRWLNNAELLEHLGLSKEAVWEACQAEFRQRDMRYGPNPPPVDSLVFKYETMEKDGRFYRHIEPKHSEFHSFEIGLFHVYPDENGQLFVIAPILSHAGAVFYTEVFPIDL